MKAGVSYYGALNGARTNPNLDVYQQRFTAASAPVLVLAGQNDSTIGMMPVMRMEEILKAAGTCYELKVYPGAEHEFDAWPRTLAFFKANLR